MAVRRKLRVATITVAIAVALVAMALLLLGGSLWFSGGVSICGLCKAPRRTADPWLSTGSGRDAQGRRHGSSRSGGRESDAASWSTWRRRWAS